MSDHEKTFPSLLPRDRPRPGSDQGEKVNLTRGKGKKSNKGGVPALPSLRPKTKRWNLILVQLLKKVHEGKISAGRGAHPFFADRGKTWEEAITPEKRKGAEEGTDPRANLTPCRGGKKAAEKKRKKNACKKTEKVRVCRGNKTRGQKKKPLRGKRLAAAGLKGFPFGGERPPVKKRDPSQKKDQGGFLVETQKVTHTQKKREALLRREQKDERKKTHGSKEKKNAIDVHVEGEKNSNNNKNQSELQKHHVACVRPRGGPVLSPAKRKKGRGRRDRWLTQIRRG